MSLIRHVGTIGGLTAVSRVFGFARDMLLARVLGAGLVGDAFQLAFTLPNTFRRLFAEGAFSVAFVPMYSKALHGDGGEAEAEKFAGDVLSVFLWVLLGFSALCMIIMPGIVWLLAHEYAKVPGKFELSVVLSRLTFPYLFFISLVAMLSGLLNARSRFGPGAVAPVLLNIILISGILLGKYLRGDSGDDHVVGYCLAAAVSLSGLAQLFYLIWASRRAGVRLKIAMPRFTPEVRQLGALILPATFGAGIYQISQLVDTFFATSLPQGSLTLLKLADRLNQMPLGIVGIALGTAILPMLSRHIHTGNLAESQRLQSNAFEIATLLTLPAAAALAVCAPAFVTAFFVGGKFKPDDGVIMAQIVVALVAGLPAYVVVKILNPGFFARTDTRTPVWHSWPRCGNGMLGQPQLPDALRHAPPAWLVSIHLAAGQQDRPATDSHRSHGHSAMVGHALAGGALWRKHLGTSLVADCSCLAGTRGVLWPGLYGWRTGQGFARPASAQTHCPRQIRRRDS